MTEAKTIAAPLEEKKRDYAQDIAKGIGILLVVFVHIFDYPKWYEIIMAITGVWLMPFFFTLSGYYYRPGARTPGECIRRRAKQLLKPYFIYSGVIWFCTTVYNLIVASTSFGETLWESVKQYLTFLFSRNSLVLVGLAEKGKMATPSSLSVSFTSITVPFWFIAMMFFADIIFFLIADFALAKMKRFISVTSGLILLSFLLNVLVDAIGFGLPWNIQNVPMATALMLVGAMFGQTKLLSKETVKTKWLVINSLVALAIVALIQWQFPGAGSFSAGVFFYFGAVEVFPCVLLGIIAPFMLVSFSRLIEKIPVLSKALIWVGFRTLPILLVHMFISKFITIFTGIDAKMMGQKGAIPGESALNLLLTIAVIVLYRIVWELLLKKIHSKKQAA
ncbi:MAG: acyltransferase family protein [Clostridia bacterium]|nr:acyltransferase family protein [Clostridia bacterium]